MSTSRLLAGVTLLFLMLPLGLAPVSAANRSNDASTAPIIPIINALSPRPGVLLGGQPTVRQFEQAVEAGYKTIVNLRAAGERGSWDEATKARESGIKYVSIPVANITDLSKANVDTLMGLLKDQSNHPIMVHCASGNRIGGFFALNAAMNEAKSVNEALAIGKNAGLTSLEPTIRAILEKGGY